MGACQALDGLPKTELTMSQQRLYQNQLIENWLLGCQALDGLPKTELTMSQRLYQNNQLIENCLKTMHQPKV